MRAWGRVRPNPAALRARGVQEARRQWAGHGFADGFCRWRRLTQSLGVGKITIMKAVLMLKKRVADANGGFAEYVVWLLPKPLSPSAHPYKYRLAYVMNRECVVRYDNERGKGDHRHFGGRERAYTFSTPRKLIADFESDIARWHSENSNT